MLVYIYANITFLLYRIIDIDDDDFRTCRKLRDALKSRHPGHFVLQGYVTKVMLGHYWRWLSAQVDPHAEHVRATGFVGPQEGNYWVLSSDVSFQTLFIIKQQFTKMMYKCLKTII